MNIVIYCGASLGNDSIYEKETRKIGKWISSNQYKLVYGGGKAGLMGVIADTVLENGGKVIGVMPKFLIEREIMHKGLTENFETNTMTERKNKMIELGDIYIALPGGPGTLEEISEVVSWARIGQNNNPCIFWNVDGYYNDLKSFYLTMVEKGFLTQSDFDKILFTNSIDELENFVKTYEPPTVRKY
ncbi:conserved hypothetical protein [Alteracholeplasma palmae J233]|uniref:Cytokinin riboside 5'-monophosphate phosphoribohydrolase n=1 Tax=Alteracholeplasma palmae (strain ATCC 49389 / J233) TaxID=1318466 RepID=U4KR63_ALTPJ|nr:TIGR00730 family Rossman fold protein [Alteracholeplasma palmae]CCV63906.1 conserved hypothetical protein [Alteracholeplasma palmae J233]